MTIQEPVRNIHLRGHSGSRQSKKGKLMIHAKAIARDTSSMSNPVVLGDDSLPSRSRLNDVMLGGYAVEMWNNDLAPRYRRGNLLYVVPGLPVEIGNDVLIRLKDGREYVRVVTNITERDITIMKFNVCKEDTLRKSQIEIMQVITAVLYHWRA